MSELTASQSHTPQAMSVWQNPQRRALVDAARREMPVDPANLCISPGLLKDSEATTCGRCRRPQLTVSCPGATFCKATTLCCVGRSGVDPHHLCCHTHPQRPESFSGAGFWHGDQFGTFVDLTDLPCCSPSQLQWGLPGEHLQHCRQLVSLSAGLTESSPLVVAADTCSHLGASLTQSAGATALAPCGDWDRAGAYNCGVTSEVHGRAVGTHYALPVVLQAVERKAMHCQYDCRQRK